MIKPVMRLVLALAVALLAALAIPTPAPAAPAPDYAAFLDGVIPAQLARHRIPGAAVVVVAGGRQVFAKGYGLADVDARTPVDPDRTGFFIASATKVWTATAVLQLVEQGRLDLHADVNRYLTDFTIRDSWPGRPVTLAHLLTHTSGFADQILGAAVEHPADAPSLAAYLARHQPDRVRPPGTLASYDNYGFALAGYLVQVISGQPFDRYVAEHVLRPLAMSGSSAAQPHPAAIDTTLARGYRPEGGGQALARGQYGPMTPAGAGVVATATDMGRFLRAQLGGGAGPRLLGPEALAQSVAPQFTHDPRLPGMAFGWEEHPGGGRRMLTKDGDVPGFHSNMAILPEQGVGIFVAYNGDGVDGSASYANKELVQRFVDRFHPGTRDIAPSAGTAGSLDRYAGDYRITRTGRDLTKAAALVSSISVEAGPDGTLTTNGPLSADPGKTTQRWTPIGPGLFQERDGEDRLGFRADGDGRVTALFSTANPTVAYERLSWWQSPRLHQILLAASLLVLLGALLHWPVAGLVRRLRGRPAPSRWAGAARLAAWVTAALVAGCTAGFAVLFSDGNRLNESILLGGSPLMTTVLALSTTAVGTTALTAAGTVAAWRHHWWTLTGRTFHTAVTLAAATFLAVAATYHLAIA
ncbi:serine hydrolase domain-containing protein [Micromonospora chersina]|uniref:serine hydrolase domain-containing protein n=1 Tax=Micromonospora chersina TaxID=47854 RepID=UPI0033CBE4CA